jgi:hypothetical protein
MILPKAKTPKKNIFSFHTKVHQGRSQDGGRHFDHPMNIHGTPKDFCACMDEYNSTTKSLCIPEKMISFHMHKGFKQQQDAPQISQRTCGHKTGFIQQFHDVIRNNDRAI